MEESNNSETDDDEISLLDLFAVLWHRRKMIIVITAACAVVAVLISILSLKLPPEDNFMPNQYTPTALMLINNSSSESGGLASALSSSGLGNLASLAGVNVSSGTSYSSLATYLVGTNTLLDSVVDKFDLLKRYKIVRPDQKEPPKSPRADSRKILKKKLTANFDEDSGVFSISFEDYDPIFAQKVVNYCVDYLSDWFDRLGLDKNKLQKENLQKNIDSTYNDVQNLVIQAYDLGQKYQKQATVNMLDYQIASQKIQTELTAKKQVYAQLKVQFELLKVQMDSESPIFQVIERAEAPDKKSGPSRGMLCVIITFAGFFLSVFLAFIMNALHNIRKDPAAMAKFSKEAADDKEAA
jgi:uncharacterized protein involved in exopolysaccharide biosynthesis